MALAIGRIVCAVSAIGWLTVITSGVSAEALALTCEQHDVGTPRGAGGGPADMTLAYDGEDTGTLTVKGPFGEMSLPATKQLKEGSDPSINGGKPYTVTGIRAAGPATVVMPDKAAIEDCVTGKLSAEDLKDRDIVFLAAMSCVGSAPPSAAAVPITADMEIALIATEPANLEIMAVYMKRTFTEASALPGGTITVESDPGCAIGTP